MTTANDPAYPQTYSDTYVPPGLTKREYFAAMAMQANLTTEEPVINLAAMAAFAVSSADALIAALNAK